MTAVIERPRVRRSVCPHRADAGRPGGLAVVRCGPVWEIRDAHGVLSWADTLDAALAEAARHERHR